MSEPLNFRSAFNGFNREDVVHYIEYLNANHENQIRQLQADLAAIQKECLLPSEDASQGEVVADMQEQFAQQEAILTALNEYLAVIKSIEKKHLIAEITQKKLSETESKTQVVLIAGYLKGDKTELVVQKAVELGVSKIVVFSSEFSSAYMNDNKLSRLNKVSVESAKQCGRAVAPPVVYADCFEEALKQGNECENKLFACEFATQNEADLNNLSGSCAIVVGSEGGFSQKESQLAFELGYKTVFLGKRILRAETASIVLTGIVMHSLKELQ